MKTNIYIIYFLGNPRENTDQLDDDNGLRSTVLKEDLMEGA